MCILLGFTTLLLIMFYSLSLFAGILDWDKYKGASWDCNAKRFFFTYAIGRAVGKFLFSVKP